MLNWSIFGPQKKNPPFYGWLGISQIQFVWVGARVGGSAPERLFGETKLFQLAEKQISKPKQSVGSVGKCFPVLVSKTARQSETERIFFVFGFFFPVYLFFLLGFIQHQKWEGLPFLWNCRSGVSKGNSCLGLVCLLGGVLDLCEKSSGELTSTPNKQARTRHSSGALILFVALLSDLRRICTTG